MPATPPNPEIEAADLQRYLATQNDDFALELFAHSTLIHHGLTSDHGGTYTDPVTGKARQFDVRALRFFDTLNREIYLAVECKSLSRAFPLVVSRVPRRTQESYHEIIRSWGRVNGVEDFAETKPWYKLYVEGRPVGKKIIQVGKSGDGFKTGDESYDKWSQALQSATDLIKLACRSNKVHQKDECFSFILPILVVSDGCLWAIDYDQEGNVVAPPRQDDSAEIYMSRDYPIVAQPHKPYCITHLHVYTRRGFSELVSKLAHPSGAYLDRIFYPP
jgi:hypothetical protein